ncbi:MAG TPA: trypsin-like peptidase domain-containing protein [Pirellulales bacterium]|nr:trypsin-like peptidase domain-containing protein [Pirellulales bacterium]
MPSFVLAQEGTPEIDSDPQATADLELVSAVERVVSRAIARAERSVVSIARRKRDVSQQLADSHPGALSRRVGPDTSTPVDAGFAANEFASGVVIDARGLILTNRHVLGDEPELNDFYVTTIDRKVFTVKTSDRPVFPMKVKASDAMSDLAVLEPLDDSIVRKGDFTPIEFGDAATLRKGQLVIALGNPYGIARDGQASASWGIVANLARKSATSSEDESQKPLHDYGTLIQTDARLNLGTSGGALINKRGEMVGLTTSLAAASGFEQPAGYAIPIDKPMLRIIQALKEGREVEYGLLGIYPENLPRDKLKLGEPGVVVSGVMPGGPAAKAKLTQGDTITHVDDRAIYDKDGLRLHVGKLPPGSTTTLTVAKVAGGKPVKRRVLLGKLRVELPQSYTERRPDWRGAVVDYRVPKKPYPAGQFPFGGPNEDFTTPCVTVREVKEGSAAWEAGLREGSLISHVGSISVGTPEEFAKAVVSQTGPIKLRLFTPDDRSQQTIVVPAE